MSMWYHNKKIDNDFLDLSLKMYHHYDYKDAALEIYWGIVYKYNKDVPMDSKELSDLLESVPHQELLIGLSYLEVGASNGNYSCYDELAKYYLKIGDVTKHEEMLKKNEIMYQNNLNKMREKFKEKKIEINRLYD